MGEVWCDFVLVTREIMTSLYKLLAQLFWWNFIFSATKYFPTETWALPACHLTEFRTLRRRAAAVHAGRTSHAIRHGENFSAWGIRSRNIEDVVQTEQVIYTYTRVVRPPQEHSVCSTVLYFEAESTVQPPARQKSNFQWKLHSITVTTTTALSKHVQFK